MDDGSCKGSGGGAVDDLNPDRNPSPNPPAPAAASTAPPAAGRRPFTSLSQEEADLALARVLQEQERAYMMLTGRGGGYAMWDEDGYYDDEDGNEEDVSDYEEELDGAALDEDEELGDAEGDARALHDAEEHDVAGRLMALAGIGDWRTMEEDGAEDDDEEGDGGSQDAWEDVDPDEYSYEELVALGEAVGTESKGLSADTIASLPSVTYQAQDKQDDNMEQCVICRVEFDEGESLVALPCKHSYHSECINHWLQLNKVCPMCSAEVSTSMNKKA